MASAMPVSTSMASMAPLPYPPPKNSFREHSVPAGIWYRVHNYDASTGLYGPTQFNDTKRGDARFSPLVDSTGKVIPTIYAAKTVRGAIAEILLHDVPTPSTNYQHDWERDKSGNHHLSRISLTDLSLVNLTTLGLRAAGLTVAEFFGTEKPDYPRTREWALHIWKTMPKAQGLHWMSVRDNTCEVVMLFGDRLKSNNIQDERDSKHVIHYEAELMKLLDDLGASLAGA